MVSRVLNCQKDDNLNDFTKMSDNLAELNSSTQYFDYYRMRMVRNAD